MGALIARPARNVHIDFFRGLALLCIFIDHTPGDWLYNITFRRLGACDAFEVFVLLAGCSASYAYGGALFRRGWAAASQKILYRVAAIYAANLMLTSVLWIITELLSRFATGRLVLNNLHVDRLVDISLVNIAALLTFTYPLGLSELLRVYILLFLGLVAVLPLLRFPRILLSLSVILYAASHLFDLSFPASTIGNPEPNLLAWQVVLVIGLVMVSEPSLRPRPLRRWDFAATAVVLAAFMMRASSPLARHGLAIPMSHAALLAPVGQWMKASITVHGKMWLHPFRLANIAAWAWIAYRLAPFISGWLEQAWARPFLLCGRHSLPVFCVSAALAPLGGVWLATWHGFAGQASYNIGGAVILVIVATLSSAWRSRQRPQAAHVDLKVLVSAQAAGRGIDTASTSAH